MPRVSNRFRLKLGHVLLALPVLIVLGLACRFILFPYLWFLDYEPREGDVLFQSLPRGSLVVAIEGSTNSPWSHCGIVAREGDQWVVYEALGQVQRVSLFQFWLRSRYGQFAVHRFRTEYQQRIPAVLESVREFVGLPYDVRYELDDEKIYCSELIYKAFRNVTGEELGRLVKLGELNWQPYERTIREIERGPVPVERLMITPRHMSEAKQLERVRDYGVD